MNFDDFLADVAANYVTVRGLVPWGGAEMSGTMMASLLGFGSVKLESPDEDAADYAAEVHVRVKRDCIPSVTAILRECGFEVSGIIE